MPTLGVFGELQVGSGALQHQVKVHGFLSAHSNDIQGDKNLGVATFVVFKGCLKPVLCLEDAEKSYFPDPPDMLAGLWLRGEGIFGEAWLLSRASPLATSCSFPGSPELTRETPWHVALLHGIP